MKSLINTVIIICCFGFIIADSSCDNGPDFDNNNQSQVEKCWIIKSSATQLPIKGASISVKYDYFGSKLGPTLFSVFSDENGKACAMYPSYSNIISSSAYAPGYKATPDYFGAIPSPIFLDPLE